MCCIENAGEPDVCAVIDICKSMITYQISIKEKKRYSE
jgi:hypothetical protein